MLRKASGPAADDDDEAAAYAAAAKVPVEAAAVGLDVAQVREDAMEPLARLARLGVHRRHEEVRRSAPTSACSSGKEECSEYATPYTRVRPSFSAQTRGVSRVRTCAPPRRPQRDHGGVAPALRLEQRGHRRARRRPPTTSARRGPPRRSRVGLGVQRVVPPAAEPQRHGAAGGTSARPPDARMTASIAFSSSDLVRADDEARRSGSRASSSATTRASSRSASSCGGKLQRASARACRGRARRRAARTAGTEPTPARPAQRAPPPRRPPRSRDNRPCAARGRPVATSSKRKSSAPGSGPRRAPSRAREIVPAAAAPSAPHGTHAASISMVSPTSIVAQQHSASRRASRRSIRAVSVEQ